MTTDATHIYLLVVGTVGGAEMDANFIIYGLVFISCAIGCGVTAKQRNFKAHRYNLLFRRHLSG